MRWMRRSVRDEGSVFFERGGGGKHEVGVAAGLGEVDVLHDEEVEFGERGGDVVGVGVRGDGVLALDVEGLESAFEDGVDHLVIVFAGGGGKGDSPGGLEFCADLFVVDLLVAGEEVGHGAEVAGALDVVVSAKRIGTGAGAHVVSGEEEKVGERGGGIGAAGVLGDAHGEEDADAVGSGDLVGDGDEGGLGDAGDALGVFEGVGLEGFFVLVEVVDPLLDELGLVEVVVEDVFGDAVEPGGVGGGVGAEEDVGALGHLVLPQVGDDEALAAELVRAFDAGGEDGMIFGGVGPDDEDEARPLDVGDGAGVAAVADGALQAHGGGVLAVAGAVVDVVGSNDGAGELLHEEALLVGALGGGDEGEGVGAVLLLDLGEFLLNEVEGFVPGDLDEGVALAEERGDEAVVGVDVSPGELALDAGGDSVGGAVGGLDLEDVAVAGPDLEAAADGAVGADGLGALDAGVAHLGFDVGDGEDGAVADGRLDGLDDVDHLVEDLVRAGW